MDCFILCLYSISHLKKNLCKLNKIEWVIAVPHNIIGPKQKYDDPYRNVVSIMINRLLQNKRPIIYGDGNQKRCFSYIDDCIYCLLALIDNKEVAGTHNVQWNSRDRQGRKVPNGVYFYTITTNYFTQTKKMIFIKLLVMI